MGPHNFVTVASLILRFLSASSCLIFSLGQKLCFCLEMADIVLGPLLQVVFDRVASQLMKTIAQRCGFEGEVDNLRRTLTMIQAVLEDAEQRQVSEKSLNLWLTELKDIAYDMDDLLDELAIYNFPPRSGPYKKIIFSVSYLRPYAVYLELFPKLRLMRQNLNVLASDMLKFSLKEVDVRKGDNIRRQTGSFIIESEVLGRNGEKEKIVELILSNEKMGNSGNVSIIPIVGLGGVGKTTLAQLAYNDERVQRDFELKLWVSVNEDFNVTGIIKLILEAATQKRCKFMGMDLLQYQLQDLLRMRRYLLVLDDVWNEDQDEWEKLRMLLSACAEGSKVIVTTRSEKIASIMGTVPPFILQGLSNEHCWDLFKQRAFAFGEEHPNLLPIGKEIVKKCGGVPLAAKTLGSAMRFKREEFDWLYVKESELWNVCRGENGILPALRLSYLHLQSPLKMCFIYCSILPKNYVINKEKLIQMWIAEGLIQSYDERKSLEDIGNEYFNDLMWMFFFEDIKKGSDGNVIECRMHNLIHDLAQSIAGNEFVILEQGSLPRCLSKIRHASIVSDFGVHAIPERLFDAKKLRTLNFLYLKGDLGEAPNTWFSRFRYLRVLNLSGSGIKRLHESISSLISLRYLDLSHTLIQMLPETVCDLSNLQVLNLSCCHDLIKLPTRLSDLFSLRHLMINGCDRLSYLPDRIALLQQLKTLSVFIVGTSFENNIKQLHGLWLEGELYIRKLYNVKRGSEASFAELNGKPKLHSLGLSWAVAGKDFIMQNESFIRVAKEVIECLQPHKNLRTLRIEGYPGTCFPKWVDNLPILTKIVLIDCKNCAQLPCLGQLPFLRILHMQGMHAVMRIGFEFYSTCSNESFRSLHELTIIDFPNLEFWWSVNGGEGFPELLKLTISKCPILKNMPHFPRLQQLELRKCNEIILRSAINLTSLSTFVVEEVKEELVHLGSLLENNPCLLYLTISSCPKLITSSLMIGGLIALKSLTIRWCPELLSLPEELQNLSSLESLEISECQSLTELPEGMQNLSALKSLSIENCYNMITLPVALQNLSVLEHLAIMYCANLASLPADLTNLHRLKSLHILSCPKLAYLPESLQHVTSLQTLEIHSCPGLKYLPEWIDNLVFLRSLMISDCHNIESLPEGLQRLGNLQHLSIRGCSVLEHRCSKTAGHDWPKIAHIPHTYVGSTDIRQQDIASSSKK